MKLKTSCDEMLFPNLEKGVRVRYDDLVVADSIKKVLFSDAWKKSHISEVKTPFDGFKIMFTQNQSYVSTSFLCDEDYNPIGYFTLANYLNFKGKFKENYIRKISTGLVYTSRNDLPVRLNISDFFKIDFCKVPDFERERLVEHLIELHFNEGVLQRIQTREEIESSIESVCKLCEKKDLIALQESIYLDKKILYKDVNDCIYVVDYTYDIKLEYITPNVIYSNYY